MLLPFQYASSCSCCCCCIFNSLLTWAIFDYYDAESLWATESSNICIFNILFRMNGCLFSNRSMLKFQALARTLKCAKLNWMKTFHVEKWNLSAFQVILCSKLTEFGIETLWKTFNLCILYFIPNKWYSCAVYFVRDLNCQPEFQIDVFFCKKKSKPLNIRRIE